MRSIICLLGLVSLLSNCGGLTPTVVEVSSYTEVDSLLSRQYHKVGARLEKVVQLGKERESKTLDMDSVGWKKELAFLEEINPNRPEYVGAFIEESSANSLSLTLKPEEKGSLKKLSYVKESGYIISLQATVHENKDVYVHHKEIKIQFNNGVITSYQVHGYQKTLIKDSTFFSVDGKIL